MYKIFKKLNYDNKRGFSLVEMLVAVGIFMSIMTLAITTLISIIGANKKAQAIKSTIDSVTFAVEDISRNIRVGTDYQCLNDSSVYTKDCLSTGSKAVRFLSASSSLVTYMFNGTSNKAFGVLTKTECPSAGSDCEMNGQYTVDLISQDSDVNIVDMKFYVIGALNELNPPRTQPRVVITASGLVSVKGSTPTSFDVQTSVSQRIRR